MDARIGTGSIPVQAGKLDLLGMAPQAVGTPGERNVQGRHLSYQARSCGDGSILRIQKGLRGNQTCSCQAKVMPAPPASVIVTIMTQEGNWPVVPEKERQFE